jgi:GNAT superfamily N-acetyltransferase
VSELILVPFDQAAHSVAFYRFMEKVRGPENFANRRKALEWFHHGFPLVDREPLRFLLMDGERVAATMGHMPVEYTVQGETVQARITHDLLVDPDYRGKGLAKKLVDNARDTGGFMPGGMWMTGQCYKIHLSCGFEDVCALRPQTLILKPHDFAVRRHLGFARRTAARLAFGVVKSRSLRKAKLALKNLSGEFSATETGEFSRELDSAWAGMLKTYDVTAARNAAFLNWKYAHHPVLSYRLLLAERRGEPCGYAIWRLPFGGNSDRRAVIVDYLVARGDEYCLRFLISKIMCDASKHDVEVLSTVTAQPWAGKILSSFGFLKGHAEYKWVVANWRPYIPPEWLDSQDHWHACLGDSDGDFWTGGQ